MKSFLTLFCYFFTWRSVITAVVALGAVLLVLMLNAAMFNSRAAYGLSILAFAFLLVVPYLLSARAVRELISNRRLAFLPAFNLKVGLALLLLTLLTAAFLPLTQLLIGTPALPLHFVLVIFAVLSCYSAFAQYFITSKHVTTALSLLPIVVVAAMNAFGKQIAALSATPSAQFLLLALTLALWAYALRRLATQVAFRPAYFKEAQAFDQVNTLAGMPLFFQSAMLKGPQQAAGSLLSGFPAAWWNRCVFQSMYVLFWPLVSVLLLVWMASNNAKAPQQSTAQLFMGMSFVTCLVASKTAGELGARARFVWLRVGGGREQVWHTLEKELWASTAVLAALLLLAMVGMWLIAPSQPYLLHYLLLTLICTLFDAYLSLCARLWQWPTAVQLLVMLVSLVGVIAAVLYAIRHPALPILVVSELSLALCALLFRSLAKLRFNSVDWMQLKPAFGNRQSLW